MEVCLRPGCGETFDQHYQEGLLFPCYECDCPDFLEGEIGPGEDERDGSPDD